MTQHATTEEENARDQTSQDAQNIFNDIIQQMKQEMNRPERQRTIQRAEDVKTGGVTINNQWAQNDDCK